MSAHGTRVGLSRSLENGRSIVSDGGHSVFGDDVSAELNVSRSANAASGVLPSANSVISDDDAIEIPQPFV